MADHDPVLLVARAMTDAAPEPALVDRVRARLDAAPRARRAPNLRWMVPTAAATALVVVIAVTMRPATRVSNEINATASTSATTPSAPSVPATSPVSAASIPVARTEGPDFSPARSRAPRTARTASPTEAELAWLARSVQPLAPIPAMTIEPLVVESTQPQPLVLPPLTITPLTIPPVNGDPNGGRHDEGR